MLELNSLNISIHVIVDLVMYLILGAYAVYTAVFYYHWKNFGTDIKVTGLTLLLYFVSTIPLLIALVSLRFII